MMNKLSRNNQKGFTLVELMVVIGIIGVLFAIALPNLLGYAGRARDTGAAQALRGFHDRSMAYFSDRGPATFVTGAKSPGLKWDPHDSIDFGNSISMSKAGVVSGFPTASHKDSGTIYYLDSATGTLAVGLGPE